MSHPIVLSRVDLRQKSIRSFFSRNTQHPRIQQYLSYNDHLLEHIESCVATGAYIARSCTRICHRNKVPSMFIGIHCKTNTLLFDNMDEEKMVHLFNLAHYGAFNPFLSRHAIALDAYAYENGINVPVGYAHCDHCGVYQVAGLTSSLRIKYAKRLKSKQSRKKNPNHQAQKADAFVSPRQRTLQVTCLACGYVKGHSSLITKKSTVASPNVLEQAKPGKKKKKKRLELSSLLEEKKRMLNSPSPLSLMDFM